MATVLAEVLSAVKVGTAVNSERCSRHSRASLRRTFEFPFECRADRASGRKNPGNINVTSLSRVEIRWAAAEIASIG
jgi:hypothetical protein